MILVPSSEKMQWDCSWNTDTHLDLQGHPNFLSIPNSSGAQLRLLCCRFAGHTFCLRSGRQPCHDHSSSTAHLRYLRSNHFGFLWCPLIPQLTLIFCSHFCFNLSRHRHRYNHYYCSDNTCNYYITRHHRKNRPCKFLNGEVPRKFLTFSPPKKPLWKTSPKPEPWFREQGPKVFREDYSRNSLRKSKQTERFKRMHSF